MALILPPVWPLKLKLILNKFLTTYNASQSAGVAVFVESYNIQLYIVAALVMAYIPNPKTILLV